MYFHKLFLTSCLAFSFLHAQSEIGLDINSNDLEILGTLHINSSSQYSDETIYFIDTSYLRTDGDNILSLGIRGENTFQGLEGLALSFGAKTILANDFMALPLFAKAIFTLPLAENIPQTSLITSFAYAPNVLSFRDAESYSEFRVEADIEIISNIHLFTGYRNIDTKYATYDKTFNNSFYGGMKLSF